ncbi:YqzL family protein [Paenibacillus sp. GCM10012307]|uniref:YqzL family protein n=1 Tax=Paenibacillus roseus TaxID=2798579 RepID=A0A934MSC0_9BACL|nr:YqzL family protein [Paenibacillus roseus]MBJ6363114.1 YqzL family protein [Paenibacillus roseus]
MRHLSWTYFMKTGDVDAFMLYREMGRLSEADAEQHEDAAVEEGMLEDEASFS